jgi:hypothetical protein
MNDYEPADPAAHRFIVELLETGLSLSNAMASLLESLEGRDPWPGEDPGEVLLQMAAGSVRPVLRTVSNEDVERAIELIAAVRDRFLADLRMAAEISGRRERMRR